MSRDEQQLESEIKAKGLSASRAPGSGRMTKMAMDFGEAIRALKDGKEVAREGWNGKGMCVWLEKGNLPFGTMGRFGLIRGIGEELFDAGPEDSGTYMPYLCFRPTDGSTVTGWLASQTDMLAEDWVVLDQ